MVINTEKNGCNKIFECEGIVSVVSDTGKYILNDEIPDAVMELPEDFCNTYIAEVKRRLDAKTPYEVRLSHDKDIVIGYVAAAGFATIKELKARGNDNISLPPVITDGENVAPRRYLVQTIVINSMEYYDIVVNDHISNCKKKAKFLTCVDGSIPDAVLSKRSADNVHAPTGFLDISAITAFKNKLVCLSLGHNNQCIIHPHIKSKSTTGPSSCNVDNFDIVETSLVFAGLRENTVITRVKIIDEDSDHRHYKHCPDDYDNLSHSITLFFRQKFGYKNEGSINKVSAEHKDLGITPARLYSLTSENTETQKVGLSTTTTTMTGPTSDVTQEYAKFTADANSDYVVTRVGKKNDPVVTTLPHIDTMAVPNRYMTMDRAHYQHIQPPPLSLPQLLPVHQYQSAPLYEQQQQFPYIQQQHQQQHQYIHQPPPTSQFVSQYTLPIMPGQSAAMMLPSHQQQQQEYVPHRVKSRKIKRRKYALSSSDTDYSDNDNDNDDNDGGGKRHKKKVVGKSGRNESPPILAVQNSSVYEVLLTKIDKLHDDLDQHASNRQHGELLQKLSDQLDKLKNSHDTTKQSVLPPSVVVVADQPMITDSPAPVVAVPVPVQAPAPGPVPTYSYEEPNSTAATTTTNSKATELNLLIHARDLSF